MPASITPLLAERLDISEEQARSLLEILLQELRRRAEADSVRLPDLGTFREEDGCLTFVPSPSLRRRVNHTYEGLSPEDLTVPEHPPEPASPAVSESASEADFPSGSPDDDQILTLDPIDEEDTPEPDTPPSAEPEPAPQGSSVDSSSIVGLVLAFIFLLGAGWFVLDRTDVWFPFSNPAPPVASEQEPGTLDTTTSQRADRSTGANTGTQADQDTAAQDTSARAAGNWAIVVASRSSRAAAEAAAEAYRARFDSVEVVPGTVNGKTWYRVAIGWYVSETAAERVLDQNASRLPSGAWTHPLR